MNLLVASNKDIASLSIKRQILLHYHFLQSNADYQKNPIYATQINGKNINLLTLNEESVKAQHLQQDFPKVELIVFISRHSSQSGKPTLSVHAPGNFSLAELGGLSKKLSVAPAFSMRFALKKLLECKVSLNLNYEVSYECTHHGPSLSVPTMFVELGSSEMQWSDANAALAVAHAAIASIVESSLASVPVVLGIGGTHYNQKFTSMALSDEVVFGHMIPKHAISNVNSELISECLMKTLGKVELAILDWKGIKSEDKPNVISTLESMDLPYRKV